MATVPDMTVKLEVLGRCATCKHWRPFWPGDGSEGGACERADGSPEALMCAADGSVMTRASFGCVMWEGKDGD